MAWDNEEKCPRLKSLGVRINQAAYSSHLGRPCQHSLDERNYIKLVCLLCPFWECIYERIN